MPQVGNKKFPYTPSGIRQAQQAYKRKRNPVAAAMNKGNLRSRLTGAMDRLNAQSNLRGARSRMENERLVGQLNAQLGQRNNTASATPTPPNRRQAIATQLGQDKMYRPDRDGPKRVQQTLPMPGRVSRPNPSQMIKRYPGGKGRGRNPRLPGRQADRRDFLPSPIRRPKPPNRRYL